MIENGIIEYYETNFENDFAHQTKYRGPPTEELEEAWYELWNRGSIEVPLDGAARLNKSDLRLKHVDFDQNRGYIAILEVFHQLHCLNSIRQYTWKGYYEGNLREWLQLPGHDDAVDSNFTDLQNVGERMHIDHCIETLRLQLMCNADVTPLFLVVDESSGLGSSADFNTHHKCRNWDNILKWQDEHNIKTDSD
ncbi:hypothetical protein F4775DRAFT_595552 [Biscogniauxia sp. FL1348]|nr:hypothetical protein F4775DRAFT_595552 [Biscogniauxia sp. FL1348]